MSEALNNLIKDLHASGFKTFLQEHGGDFIGLINMFINALRRLFAKSNATTEETTE